MNRKGYDKAMYDILDGNSKFKKLKKDPILLKEGQLRFIRTYNVLLELLKKQGIFDENIYKNIDLIESKHSRLYGTPKIYKTFTNIPSFVNCCNYNLAKYLCKLLQAKIPSMHSTQDTLTFIKEVEEVIDYNNFFSII